LLFNTQVASPGGKGCLVKEMVKGLASLNDVNGGGASLKTAWKDEVPEGATLEDVRKIGEKTCMNCYNRAIRQRITKIDQAISSELARFFNLLVATLLAARLQGCKMCNANHAGKNANFRPGICNRFSNPRFKTEDVASM
jgi:hypothetical protein